MTDMDSYLALPMVDIPDSFIYIQHPEVFTKQNIHSFSR